MPACAICNHPMLKEINQALIEGKNLSEIARTRGVSRNSLEYHQKHHLSRQLVQAYQKKQLTEGFDLLSKIDSILEKLEIIFSRNFHSNKDLLALKALAEQRNTLQLLANISIALHDVKKQEEAEVIEIQAIEQEEEYAKGLEVLTNPELEMFQKLIEKVNTQDKRMIIIPEIKDTTAIKWRIRPKMDKQCNDLSLHYSSRSKVRRKARRTI